MKIQRKLLYLAFAMAAATHVASLGSVRLGAQSPSGPQTLPTPPQVVRIPIVPTPDKPTIPADEIIRRFAEQEDEFARVRAGYTYRKIVRLEEIGPEGKPTGQTEVITLPVVTSEGIRAQRPAGEQQSTLQVVSLERDALESLAAIPAFPLGTAELAKYEITYEGIQPVDELTTFVFRVAPKQLERTHAYFNGLIWVDKHDLAIVKTYGKWVTETGDLNPPELPFAMYETYRQPVANKYWMPAYSRSDSSVTTKGGTVQVRLVIRWDNYTPVSTEKSSSVPATTSTTDPAAKASQ